MTLASGLRPILSLELTSQVTPPGAPALGDLGKLVDAFAAAEPARLWINEHHSPHPLGPFPPAVPLLGFIAGRVPGLPLGTSVLIPGLHAIEQLAEDCAFVARAADFMLGIGRGYRIDYERRGLKQQSWREMVDLIPRLRTLWMGTEIPFHPSGPIPVIVGSAGPKTLQAAAEVADGVVLHPSQPLGALERQIQVARHVRGPDAHVAVIRDTVLGAEREESIAFANEAVLAKYRNYIKIGRPVISDDLTPVTIDGINYSTMGRRLVVGGVDEMLATVDALAALGVDEVIFRVTYAEWSLDRAQAALDVFAETANALRTPA